MGVGSIPPAPPEREAAEALGGDVLDRRELWEGGGRETTRTEL